MSYPVPAPPRKFSWVAETIAGYAYDVSPDGACVGTGVAVGVGVAVGTGVAVGVGVAVGTGVGVGSGWDSCKYSPNT